jgi:uncharacterized membrane protein YccC
MRLKANKTPSQRELAIKLRVEKSENQGFFTWERRRLLIHAAKTALAAALCWWIAMRFGLPDGYWGAISAIIVLQSNFGATISASRDRIFGTLIGALLGFFFTLVGTLPWNFILAVLAAVIVCGLLGLRSSSRLAGVTICIVMLVQQRRLALDLGAGPRDGGLPGHCGGASHLHAGLSRSRAAAAARRTGQGVPGAGHVLRSDS